MLYFVYREFLVAFLKKLLHVAMDLTGVLFLCLDGALLLDLEFAGSLLAPKYLEWQLDVCCFGRYLCIRTHVVVVVQVYLYKVRLLLGRHTRQLWVE